MASFNYNYQNRSLCCFPIQIVAIVIYTSLGLPNVTKKVEIK